MKKQLILNLAAPPILALGVVATTRSDGTNFLFFLVLVVVVLGLGILSLFAPLLFWKGHGAKSLLVPMSLIASVSLALLVEDQGSRLMLRDTPVLPESFLRGARQTELAQLGDLLLANPRAAAPRGRLGALGLTRVEVDTCRRVVRMSHYRGRTWHEYLYAPDGLPGRFSRTWRLSNADFGDWDELRQIAKRAFPDSVSLRRGQALESDLATRSLRHALGDSFIAEVRRRGADGFVTPNMKRSVIGALNRQVSFDSGLIADSSITYEGTPPGLQIDGQSIADSLWTAKLLRDLLTQGLLTRDSDGAHLKLRPGLSGVDRARAEWAQLGLLELACAGLFEVDAYPYDRQLQPQWYLRVW